MQMGAACCTDALSVEASPSCLQNSPTLIFRVRVREEIMLTCVMRHVVTIKVTERTVQPRAIKNSCKDMDIHDIQIWELAYILGGCRGVGVARDDRAVWFSLNNSKSALTWQAQI